MAITAVLFGAVMALVIVSAALGSEPLTVFPQVEGKALTGDKFTVPDDLEGEYNLIAVAFLREQQEDVDTWIPRAERMEDRDGRLRFYEFPVLPEMNAVTRWFIYQGMRGGISSERARARTVTFHIDKAEFRKRLGIESEDHISLFLLDREGRVLWRDTGEWSEEREKGLLSVLGPPPAGE